MIRRPPRSTLFPYTTALPIFALALAFAVLAEEPTPPTSTAADAGTSAAEKKPEQVRAIVHLKDGGLVRGTVRRIKLGKSITLRLSSGKSVTFDYDDIVTVEMLGAAADAGTPEAPAADSGEFPAQSVTAS